MLPHDRRPPGLELESGNFARTSRGNILAALAEVLPAETINKVRAGLAEKDKAADFVPLPNSGERSAGGSEADAS